MQMRLTNMICSIADRGVRRRAGEDRLRDDERVPDQQHAAGLRAQVINHLLAILGGVSKRQPHMALPLTPSCRASPMHQRQFLLHGAARAGRTSTRSPSCGGCCSCTAPQWRCGGGTSSLAPGPTKFCRPPSCGPPTGTCTLLSIASWFLSVAVHCEVCDAAIQTLAGRDNAGMASPGCEPRELACVAT